MLQCHHAPAVRQKIQAERAFAVTRLAEEGRAQPIFAARAAKLERARPARRAAATAQAP